MPLVIDATVGGANSNSYNLASEVDAYALGMAPSDAAVWAALANDTAKAPFVVRAARVLDTIPFPGAQVSYTQALMWPRWGVEAPVSTADLMFYGRFYDPTIIPPAVKKAHSQLSVYLAVNAGTDPFAGGDAGPLTELHVGPVDLKFRDGAQGAGRDYLEREIYPILRAGNCAGSAHTVRLTR